MKPANKRTDSDGAEEEAKRKKSASAAASLSALLKQVRACRLCVEAPHGDPLPHAPRPVLVAERSARICIIGQAPGTRVHASGRPFTDPSGDRLRDWLDVSSDQFYDSTLFCIIPMGFCFPGQNERGADLPPRSECAVQWHEKLFALLPQIELFLLVGFYAQRFHLGKKCRKTLTETVADWREYAKCDDQPLRLPLPHPSWRNNGWLRKNDFFERDILPFLRAEVQKRLTRP